MLYHYNNKKILIDETKYLKSFKGAYDALQYMVANTLIAGIYKAVDDAGKLLQLTFTNTGMVKGLAGIKNIMYLPILLRNRKLWMKFALIYKPPVKYAMVLK